MIKDNVSEFLGAFNELQEALAKRLNYKGDKDFATYLYWGKENNDVIIMKYFKELDAIREFRNLLTHESNTEIYPIAYPNEKLIDRMKYLVDKIGNQKVVGELFLKEVTCLKSTDSLKEVLKTINNLGYSQYPVFDDKGLLGILSENGITNYLAYLAQDEEINLRGSIIADILKVDAAKNLYKIIDEYTSIFYVEELFKEEILKGNSAFVVLISNRREPKSPEDIIGIVTPWDVPKILEFI